MDALINWLIEHAEHAHWYVFFSILLAGLNIPISADLIIIISAILAATIIPENIWILFFSVFIGCMLSAQLAYFVGWSVGPKLQKMRYFSKILHPERMQKIQNFYEKHGFLTLIIGRFIPFGIRNAIFMTTGMSKSHFGKFAIRDAIACFIWSGASFYTFYTLGNNYQKLKGYLHIFNILIFLAFAVAVITFIWYKRNKKSDKTHA